MLWNNATLQTIILIVKISQSIFQAAMRGVEGPMGLTGSSGPEGEIGPEGTKGEQGEIGEPVSNITRL